VPRRYAVVYLQQSTSMSRTASGLRSCGKRRG
jgi:hypothetical protein